MIITCPECKARYNVKDDLIPDKGKNVRCKKCKTAFRTYQDGTCKRLIKKEKAVAQPEKQGNPEERFIAQTAGGTVHSTVRIDASALQAAMKKQFVTPAEPKEPESDQITPPRESSTDFNSFENMQDSDEFAKVSPPPSPEPEPDEESPAMPDFSDDASGPAFQTQAHPVLSFDQPADVAPEENLENDEPDSEPDADPFKDEEDPFGNNNDPLSTSGNFGFESSGLNVGEEEMTSGELSLSDQPDTGDASSDPENSFEIPEQPVMPEENFNFTSEVEVPDPSRQDPVRKAFDVKIDGTVYPNIDVNTLDRWIREGRILEHDQVSTCGASEYQNADAFPELKEFFNKYFQSGSDNSQQQVVKKKKGFFARLFGR